MFVDSHCHLHLIDYDKLQLTEKDVVLNAAKNNVEHLLCVATKLEQFSELNVLAEKYSNVSISIGEHPNELTTPFNTDELLALALNKHVVAIGETGLDYYRTKDAKYIILQQEKFKSHIKVALQSKKPLIVHTRDAKEDTIKILESEKATNIGGVIHCFTEDLDMALRCIDLGFYISFSGIVSFKNATSLQAVVKEIPLANMLIETDCPYLAPNPMRGKINQPAYVKYVAEAIAHIKEVPVGEVARITTENYFRLFKTKV